MTNEVDEKLGTKSVFAEALEKMPAEQFAEASKIFDAEKSKRDQGDPKAFEQKVSGMNDRELQELINSYGG
jgi:hypothetical protein